MKLKTTLKISSITHAGKVYPVAKNGTVEVPDEAIGVLKSHGFVPVTALGADELPVGVKDKGANAE